MDNQSHDESDEELYDLAAENPNASPKQGDLKQFLNKDVNPPTLIKAEVMHIFKSVLNKYPGWCNVRREDFLFESSVDLPNTRWKFLKRNLSETSPDDAPENEASAALLPNEMETPESRPSAGPSRIKQAMVRRARQVKAALSRNEESDSN